MEWWSGLAALVAILLLIWRLRDRARLIELESVASAYAEGDFQRRAGITGDDRIARLGHELNHLGERLASARTQLEGQRRLLDDALGALGEGVACIDELNQVAYANDAYREFVAGGGAVIGKEYYLHLQSAAIGKIIESARTGAPPPPIDLEHRRRQLRASAVPAGENQIVVVLHDVTELRFLEDARRDFVASVSHELKTPLTSIIGFSDTLLDGALEDTAQARSMVERISRHAQRLGSLVGDVLTLSRLEQGAWQVQVEDIEMADVLDDVIEAHYDFATRRAVAMNVEVAEGLNMVGDSELLHQMFGNLVSNAVRYNRNGGTVTVTAGAVDQSIVVTVADTGIGIPPEHRERIFDRFYRVDAHRSRQTGGTGLGLAIVKQLVVLMQGSITVDSGPDGSIFTVRLPRRPLAADPRRQGQ